MHPSPSSPRRSGRRIRLALIAFLLAAAVSGTAPAAGATAPDDAVEWSVAPADEAGEDGRISLRHVVDPGGTAADHIAVTNRSAVTAEFTVRAGDGVVGSDGAFDIAEGEPVDAGAWISIGGLEGDRLTLAAGETRVLPVTIAVPADATPGDHPAGIVVGLSQDADGITVTHRVGVRLHLQVAGDIAASLAVSDVQASFAPSWIPFAPGILTVEATVSNTGNVRLGAASSVTVSGPFGLSDTRSTHTAAELLPGDETRHRVELEVWPLFTLFGGVTVSPSALGEDAVDLPDAVSAEVTAVAISWTGVAVLVIVAVAVLVIVRRRRRAAANASAPVSPPES